MSWRQRLARAVSQVVLTSDQRAHLQGLHIDDAGHGWDRFGMSAEGVSLGLSVVRWAHDYYFRVVAHGAEHIPREGATILAANHSGMLPLDGFMLYANALLNTHPARVPRAIADYFVPGLPFVNVLFSRGGMITGSRGNVHAALEAGDLLELFPEGTRGIGKGWSRRYQLQRWTVGHAELAIRHRAAIVPVGIVGAEETLPQVARIDGIHSLGIPYLPIPGTPVPLPSRIHIHYGEPIDVAAEYEPAQSDEPGVLRELADRVRDEVAALIDHGLATRPGVFR